VDFAFFSAFRSTEDHKLLRAEAIGLGLDEWELQAQRRWEEAGDFVFLMRGLGGGGGRWGAAGTAQAVGAFLLDEWELQAQRRWEEAGDFVFLMRGLGGGGGLWGAAGTAQAVGAF
jgi:hypothetical protein